MAPRRPSARTLVPAVAGGAAAAALVATAIVLPGYDVQEVDRVESAVWVTRASGEYARLDTDLAQIDTVRSVADPSNLAQAGSAAIVLGQGDRQFWAVDPAVPADLVVDAGGGSGSRTPASVARPSPPGTRAFAAAGRWALFLTDVGDSFVGPVDPGRGENLVFELIDPFADVVVEEDEERPKYLAVAGAVSPRGLVGLYSAAESAVRVFDAATREQTGASEVGGAPPAGEGVQLAFVGDRWVMLAGGLLWIQGRGDPVETGAGADALLQESTETGSAALIADSAGLRSVDLGSGEVRVEAEVSGEPAAPVEADGVRYAAWLSEDAGALWSSATGELAELDVDAEALRDASVIEPVLRSNGDRAVLNEATSGLLWLVPSGQPIPLDQWDVSLDSAQSQEEIEVEDASQQLPPTAEPDSFGVRPGALVRLPVLFNDHDPNRADVLSVVPDSLAGGLSDPGFGELGLVGQNQTVTVRVTASAGQATFSYAVTDGLAASAPAQVTLTVIPEEQNSAPVWCGVPGCTQEWPSPQLAAGGTVSVSVLDGWVDPEGDAFVLQDVVPQDLGAPIVAVPTADGRVAIRHLDQNAPPETIVVTVVVTDARGASATRDLVIQVSAAPRIELRSTTVAVQAGVPAVVDVLDAVSGGSGSYRLLDAVDSSTRGGVLSVTPNVADGVVTVAAAEPGEYTVALTVQDTQSLAERTGILRVSAAAAPQPLTTAPLTAFVRAGEDSTVGVLDAVTNTSGRVLIVGSAEASTPLLSTSVVGQTYVRVSGSTADGLPGPIGAVRYAVTDGAGNWVEGVIDVFLVAPARDLAPIAVPDAVSVRAGALVDIPVLANDVSPRGERLAIHPDLVGSGAPGELAFVSGTLVRYVAPEAPGVYTLTYNAYVESSPDRLAAATITVSVLEEGANRAPVPRSLTARVLAGHSVDIAVDGVGVDPDGDSVRLVDVGQPGAGQGSASIAADGRTIVYRAPETGVTGGQVEFGYTVRDARGALGEGTVRVGVLVDAIGDVTPITFSDPVRVQVSTPTPLTVRPLDNDRDPSQGALRLVSLQPNVSPGDPEYARLESLIGDATDLEAGIVSLTAGDQIGVNSYIYTVESSASSSTAQGLIIVTVATAAAPDRPVVADTVIDLDTRRRLETGVDVVKDKVTWISGDVAALELSLWREDGRYTVEGRTISGAAPLGGDLVPFRLSGVGADGAEVASYGFLVIPPFDDMRVQLAGGIAPVSVEEGGSERFDLRELAAVDPRDSLELLLDAPFPVQRGEASCEAAGGTRAVYEAGRGAPWTDSCSVFVRVRGQETWSVVPVPVLVAPGEPQPILSSITRTINPGDTETVDMLGSLTTWEGGRVGDVGLLDYSIGYSGTSFVVAQQGTSLTISAQAGAVAGTHETVTISVSNFGGLTATITAIVGVAPPDAPRGATVAAQCSVTSTDCTVTVVGAPGEYDPFAGRPGGGLTLVEATSSAGCAVASIAVANTTQLRASWPAVAKPVGGTCSFSFTVQDAQGRKGLGVFELDLQGYPAAPATVATTAYTATSVTLRVSLGAAASAHPAVTSVELLEGAVPVGACSPSGPTEYVCEVGGLVNGERHVYTARALNAVGESDVTTPHETWAYAAPVITSLSGTPVYDAGRTTTTEGVVSLSIGGGEDVAAYRILNTSMTVTRTGAVTAADAVLPAGSAVAVEVVPISRFTPPIGSGNEGSVRSTSVVVAGAPSFTGAPAVTADPGGESVTVTVLPALNANGSALPATTVAVASLDQSVTCVMSGSEASFTGGMGAHSGGPTIEGLTPNTLYWVTVCGSNGFGAAQSDRVAVGTYKLPPPPQVVSGYAVATTYVEDLGDSYWWGLGSAPTITPLDAEYSGYTLEYQIYGFSTTTFSLTAGSAPTTSPPRARYCLSLGDGNTQCTDWSSVPAQTAPTTMRASLLHCGWPATADAISVSGGQAGRVFIGWILTDPTPGAEKWQYTLTWQGDFAPLNAGGPIRWDCVRGAL